MTLDYGRPAQQGWHYILPLWFLLFSSPILSGRRLNVYHTATYDVALVRVKNAGLKCAARGSLKTQDTKIRHLRTIAKLCRAISLQTLHDVWPSPGLVHYIYIFGGSCPLTGFCQVQRFSRCDQQHSTEGATYIRLYVFDCGGAARRRTRCERLLRPVFRVIDNYRRSHC